jgi:hypothetical protein
MQDGLPGICCGVTRSVTDRCQQPMYTLTWPPHCWQAAIDVDLEPWKEGVKEEHIEQLYCGLGEASLRIQVPSPPRLHSV